jgi:hypothetical protein
VPATVDQRPQYGHYDSRTGLGYGLTEPSGRHAPRSAGSVYPYHEKPSLSSEDHEELDDELQLDPDVEDAIRTKTLAVALTNDFFAGFGTDPFYYAAGNTKLSESTQASGTSMVPFPKMYDKAQFGSRPSYIASLGPTYGFSSSSTSTGSKLGNSKPVMTVSQAIGDSHIERVEDLLDNEELDERHIELIRQYTREVIQNNDL